MKQIIINVVNYKLSVGQSKEDILTGLYHTICDSLEISHAEGLVMIRKADDQKAISDSILKAYQPDHQGLQYNKSLNSRQGRSYPKSTTVLVDLSEEDKRIA